MPEHCSQTSKPAGTIYGEDQEALRYGLPSAETIALWEKEAPFLVRDKRDYAAEGLYAGRSQDWQTAKASRPRFAPTPIYDPLPAELFDEVPAQIHVTARVYDASLPAREKR